MAQKLKAAVIGVGGISKEHIQSYLKNENVELYAFCDINEHQLKKRGEQFGITRLYTDAQTMLSELKEIDIVSVCTWNSAHAPCAIAALNAGKHVLCEKPMALNAAQALEMQKAAEKNGKLLMIGFVRRFGNDCRVLKEFSDAGFFGEFYYAKATYLRRNGNPGGWFGDKSRSGGGPLIDLGVHVIDLTRYLMGNHKPVSVYGATYQKLFNRPGIKGSKDYLSVSAGGDDICDVEDLAAAMIRYDNGAMLTVETAFSLNIKHDRGEIELFGDKGGALINPDVHLFSEQNGYLVNTDFDIKTALDFSGLFANEINHFVDCVLTGAPCKSPAKDGVDIMRILDAVYESARTGHEVVLK